MTTPTEDWRQERARVLSQARVVVVKVGSAVLADAQGLSLAVLENLAGQLARLRDLPFTDARPADAAPAEPRRLVLVSSGAVAAGRAALAARGHVKADEPCFVLSARKGIIEAGGGSHVQKAGELLEQVGGKAVVSVHLRPERTGQNGLHGEIHRNGSDVGHKLENIATGQGGGGALHVGKLAHFGGALKSGKRSAQKIPCSGQDFSGPAAAGGADAVGAARRCPRFSRLVPFLFALRLAARCSVPLFRFCALPVAGPCFQREPLPPGIFTGAVICRNVNLPVAVAPELFVVHTTRKPPWILP